MKTLLKTIVATLLAFFARAILKKYRPKVVMVTGSVGKTSTKDATAAVLGERFNLRASEKSYNSEFGVPLTIIGAKNPWENASAWGKVFQEALALLVFPNLYPKLLVLEVGADRPGDLARILRIATPDVVVVTRLPEVPVHVEAYASPQAVRDEEFAPAYALSAGSPLVVCADDPYAIAMAARLDVSLLTFGFADGADVQIAGYSFFIDGDTQGMEATITVAGETHALRVAGAIGRSQLLAPAAAIACARALGVSVADALSGASSYAPPPGRARLLAGIKESLLVDDSYNASPAAVEEALAALALIPGRKRRIAVLGDMLELGRYSQEEHARIGAVAARAVDVVVAVGTRARAICDAALATGLAEGQVWWFPHSREAATHMKAMIREGDVVLVKGSQSVRTERIMEALLVNDTDREQLVRQEKEWQVR